MNDVTRPLQTVATGLGLVYAGLCVQLISIIWMIALPSIINNVMQVVGRSGFIYVIASIPALMLLAMLLDVGGRLMCLAVPKDQSGSQIFIYVSVACTFIPFVITANQLAGFFLPSIAIPLPVITEQLQVPMPLIGSVLFVLFLKNLGQNVQRQDLADQAISLLVMGGVVILLAFSPFLLFLVPGIGMVVVVLVLSALIVGILALIRYASLLTQLRDAILQYTTQMDGGGMSPGGVAGPSGPAGPQV